MPANLSRDISSEDGLRESRPLFVTKLEERVRYNLCADLPLLLAGNRDLVHRIGRRSRDLLGKIVYLERARRLMDLAKKAILESDRRRRPFSPCATWWAGSLSGAKGRMKRDWLADPGGIYLCIAIYPALLRERWQLYNVATGVALCEILREWGMEAEIRWLNDIMINGKKAAGILAETISTPNLAETYLLTGLGINVNQRKFPPHIQGSSTSLLLETGRPWPVFDLGTHILSRIAFYFAVLHDWEASCLDEGMEEGPGCPVIKAYKSLCASAGRRILYGKDLENSPGIPAVASQIMADGALEIVLEDGHKMQVNTGEIRYED